MSLADQLAQIKASITEAESELTLLNSGRKVSASRVRKQLQKVKQQSQVLRKSVIDYTKGLPTKSRVKPDPEKSNFVSDTPTDAPSTLIEPTTEPELTDATSTMSKPKKKRIAKSKKV